MGVDSVELNISPEERLDLLYELLVKRDPNAIALFAEYSQPNQFLTFLQSAPFHQRNIIEKNDEYIVIIRGLDYPASVNIFVIGLDDNYNFFCHRLPERRRLDSPKFSASVVRNLMGFDLHYWEVSGGDYAPRLSVRVQGDIVFRFIDVFENEVEFFLTFLIYQLSIRYPAILSVYYGNSKMKSYLRDFSKKIFYLSPSIVNSVLRVTLGKYYILAQDYFDKLYEKTRSSIKTLQQRESRLRLVLGNHHINMIGVPLRSLPRNIISMFHVQTLGILNRIFIVLRPHHITILHDEHKSVDMFIPMSFVFIDTLDTSGLQVRREDLGFWPRSSRTYLKSLLNNLNVDDYGGLYL